MSSASESSDNNEGLIAIMQEMKNTPLSGRVNAEFDIDVLAKDPSKDILLQDGDSITIPEFSNQVYIFGEVSTDVTVRFEKDKDYVLKNLKKLVVKEVHGSGGYGMMIGSASNNVKINMFAKKIQNNPENYIAQPILDLSTVPIFKKDTLSPRHVDLRPFTLIGNRKNKMVAGGLTRVALKEGSLIVNSSQGGGVKDTWVLGD